jgi:hypothetical protein
MVQYLRTLLSRLSKNKKAISTEPIFDIKYKSVVAVATNHSGIIWDKVIWVNDICGNSSVDVQFREDKVYFAFEDPDDALYFKIKYFI